MSKGFSRRLFLGSVLAGLADRAFANAPKASLRPVPRPGTVAVAKPAVTGGEALVAGSRLTGRVAYAVADVKTGLMLETREAATGQPPASVAKAVTALYALEALGPQHRFATRLVSSGVISNGTLSGDLVLAGGGDPTLDTDALADMAKRLKAAGVNRVKGRFLVWEGALPFASEIDKGQPEHVSYNPAVSGIALNYNGVHFEWKRGAKGYGVTMQARTEKYRPSVDIARMQINKRRSPVYTYQSKDGRDLWTVASEALGKGGSRWLPVRNPGGYAGDVFRSMAKANGIELPQAQVVSGALNGRALVTHKSAELRIILRDMLRWSNNLTAEMVGMSASVARGARVSGLKASADEMNRWAASKLGMRDAQLVDHSGLGDASRVSAGDLAAALVRVHGEGRLKPILKAISMRDSKGRPIKDHPVEVVAKTGTLNFVSALAGYMTAQDGTELAFVMFAADEKARSGIRKEDREAPRGAKTWNRRAKVLQQQLIERWGALYGS